MLQGCNPKETLYGPAGYSCEMETVKDWEKRDRSPKYVSEVFEEFLLDF
jgi:hypothetical protein